MKDADWNRVNAMLADCAISLMSAFRTAVVHDLSEQPLQTLKDGILAVIGFGGDEMRGSLVLSASRGLLATSYPVSKEAGAIETATLQDWAGELANQLLGRLKACLLGHRITILLGTPTTVSGLDLRVRSRGGELLATPLWFRSGADWLVVRLDAASNGDVTLSEAPDSGCVAKEGDLLLF